jgi:hypothetical protein
MPTLIHHTDLESMHMLGFYCLSFPKLDILLIAVTFFLNSWVNKDGYQYFY